MITVESALDLIAKFLPKEFQSEDLFLEDLVADRDYPPFNRVMMDGIALSFEVYESGRRYFSISGLAPAGEAVKTLENLSSCIEVMTGAPLPLFADLIIPYEHITIKDGIANITVDQPRVRFENVHIKGSDCTQGKTLLQKNAVVNGPHIGIAASLGYFNPKTTTRPKINIISTGDELVPIQSKPLDHQIRCSNAHALEASLRKHGYSDITLSHLRDDKAEISTHFFKSSQTYDVLIYSGGVSKGKFDYLPDMWQELGVTKIFHGISQRPGKPLWFGMDLPNNTAVFGLPGNPVSSLVCLHRYFLKSKEVFVVLDEDIKFEKDLTYFVPVKISYERSGFIRATPMLMKNSGEFSALAGSDGFIELPKEKNVFKAGESFLFCSWEKQ